MAYNGAARGFSRGRLYDMKITEHIYFYGEEDGLPLWGMSTSNTTVIKGRRLAIVDPGPAVGPHLMKVRRGMKRDGLDFEDIEKIVVTHAHADHAAAIPRIAGKLGAAVCAHPIEKRILEKPSRFWREEFEAAGPIFDNTMRIPKLLLQGLFHAALGPHGPAGDVFPLREGDSIDIGIPANIVELPGHTRGEIGIHLPDDRALICGDLVHWGRYDLPSLNLPASDIGQAMSSIRKMIGMELEVVIPGHQGVVRGRARIRKWLEAALARCDRMIDITSKEVQKGGRVQLFELGRKLKESNKDIPFYEEAILAFVLLKGAGYFEGAYIYRCSQ